MIVDDKQIIVCANCDFECIGGNFCPNCGHKLIKGSDPIKEESL